MKVMRYKTQDEGRGSRSGVYTVLLVKQGRKWAHVIFMDAAGIELKRVPVADVEQWMWECDAYPLKQAIKRFKMAGRKFGITKAARVALRV